jgi:dienelactone hydrolase
MSADGTDLIKGLDWLAQEAARAGSRFHNKVNTERVAAMGMSCGGLMSYGASSDKRVVTVGIWNSGLVQPDEKIYSGLHGSVILVTGGESDVAYPNAKRDFESLPAKVPVFYGVYPSVGHGGTYNEDNGGAYGVAAVAWLKWQLQGDTSAKGRGFFTGNDCVVCKDEKWIINSRAL